MRVQVEGISEREWNVTEAKRDLSVNNISHKFWSTKSVSVDRRVAGSISSGRDS